ncbi:MAG: hypothetical protein AB7H80_09550, partial [Candidatus Kapaibacterium sp.]
MIKISPEFVDLPAQNLQKLLYTTRKKIGVLPFWKYPQSYATICYIVEIYLPEAESPSPGIDS